MEWEVVESRLVVRQLPRVPREIQARYCAWRQRVHEEGPNIQGGYRTHALRGKREGEKSAWLGRQWRVIFRVFEGQLIVEALELTPHKY
jgi:plasmid maintenance system killer protein